MAQVDFEKNAEEVARVIRENGKPNPQYPSDLDLDYGTLCKLVKFGGVPAVLKNMKKKKMVDFADQGFFKDNSIITLIGDYNAPAQPTQITYEQIKDKVKTGGETNHTKVESWQ